MVLCSSLGRAWNSLLVSGCASLWGNLYLLYALNKMPTEKHRYFPCLYVITESHVKQESTVIQQLDCGVRYCDLRIAHRPNDSSTDLYFYHGVYTTVTVEVQQIKYYGNKCSENDITLK